MPNQNWQTIQVKQLSEAKRKLEIPPSGSNLPVGGAVGFVLTKNSAANYDVIWAPPGSPAAGNGIVVVGNVVHFAQAAAYTPGGIPFASGAATMGFDAANLFWDAANAFLGVGTNAPTDRLAVYHLISDAGIHIVSEHTMATDTVGGTKRALNGTAYSTGAAGPWNAGLISGGSYSAQHQGSGATTSVRRYIGIEVYAGKGNLGTGNMAGSTCVYIQSQNANAIGTVTDAYDIYIAAPNAVGAISNNYAIYQVSTSAFNFLGGNLSICTATFDANIACRLEKSFTVTGAATIDGFYSALTETAGGAASGIYRAGNFAVTLAGAQNYTSALALTNIRSVPSHNGTGTATAVLGIYLSPRKSNTGVVTNMYGAYIQAQNANAGNAIGTLYDLYVAAATVTGAITTHYGLYLSALGGTTTYGIAQVGTTELNYLAGFSAFGSAAPVNTAFALFGASTATVTSQRILRGSAAYGGTVEGDFWNDFTQHCLIGYLAGVKQYDERVVFAQTDNQTVTNTNVETTLFGSGIGTLTMPANFFVAGKTLHLRLQGFHTVSATPPSIVYRVKLGGVTFATLTFTDMTDSNQYFEIDFVLTCRTTGAGGTGIGQGYLLMHESTGVVSGDLRHLVMTATAAMNTTGALALDVTAQPAAADAGSLITITNATVEILA